MVSPVPSNVRLAHSVDGQNDVGAGVGAGVGATVVVVVAVVVVVVVVVILSQYATANETIPGSGSVS